MNDEEKIYYILRSSPMCRAPHNGAGLGSFRRHYFYRPETKTIVLVSSGRGTSPDFPKFAVISNNGKSIEFLEEIISGKERGEVRVKSDRKVLATFHELTNIKERGAEKKIEELVRQLKRMFEE